MEVTIGKAGLKESHQDDFPETVKCHKCGGKGHIAFVAHEGYSPKRQQLVCDLHENGGKGDYWVHDCCSVAVYICRNCFEPIARMNQG